MMECFIDCEKQKYTGNRHQCSDAKYRRLRSDAFSQREAEAFPFNGDILSYVA